MRKRPWWFWVSPASLFVLLAVLFAIFGIVRATYTDGWSLMLTAAMIPPFLVGCVAGTIGRFWFSNRARLLWALEILIIGLFIVAVIVYQDRLSLGLEFNAPY